MVLASFLVFLAAFAFIGILSFRFSKKGTGDYYLASQSVKPWLVGLSAVATNNSGYMFIGVIGYTYVAGFEAVWLMLGWILGDFVGSHYVHRKLRSATVATGETSFGGVITAWQGYKMPMLQKLLALVAFIFLMAYASAQLVAGSKALMVLLDWPAYAGALVGAVIIVAYCMAGGIRASIWTDAAQSFVMVFAMTIMMVVALNQLGGVSSALEKLSAIPGYLDLMPESSLLPGLAGAVLFVLGWFFAGLSVIGQPHVMVRFMTLEQENKMGEARCWYYSWFCIFYFMATVVGLLSRILLPDVQNFDAELALPTMAMALLPSVLVGLILAGIFAATMSTADSLVLACSSVISNDLISKKNNLWLAKGSTLLVVLGALIWAIVNKQSVFSLVVMAWSSMAAAFAPLLIVLAFGGRFNQTVGIVMVISSLLCALLWRYLGWHTYIYEGLPAIIFALSLYACSVFLKKNN